MLELYRSVETDATAVALDGVAREGLALDVKRDPYMDPRELGKDMAAFANATGGVVLVGAYEDAKLIRLNPLPVDVANRQRQEFENALKDRCSPTPVVRPCVLQVAGGHVVAINVDPFPGQPIGVSTDGGKRKEGVGFAFPVRAASQTVWLLPEQLSMLMLPELRWKAVTLSSIPQSKRKVVLQGWTSLQVASVIDLDLAQSMVEFRVHCQGDRETGVDLNQIVYVPLDAIKRLWKVPSRDSYRVLLDGDVAIDGNGWAYQHFDRRTR